MLLALTSAVSEFLLVENVMRESEILTRLRRITSLTTLVRLLNRSLSPSIFGQCFEENSICFIFAVTRLLAGDFSRTTVELICNSGYSHKLGKTKGNNISSILKVHNLQRVVAEFEDYRELVKIRANKLSKKHSRCMADGNEFLGFHGTTLSCSLGLSNISSNLCFSDQCGVCQILRHGFTSKTRPDGIKGVLTASTSSTALECIEIDRGRNRDSLKALVLCRVIAGRVHKPMQTFEDPFGFSEFDSLALKMGSNSRIEELYLLSNKALLPCFVIIFKP